MTFATFGSNRNTLGRVAMLAGCLFAGSLGVARAATPADEVPSVVVSYRDLDLSTAEGARTLYKRISAAANKVCPPDDGGQPLLRARNRACREAAIDRAVHAVNNAQLAALQAEHVKRG